MALPEVLLVDDDFLIRLMLRDALVDVPCSVHEADSGDAALQWLSNRTPSVLMLDLVMPGRSGLDVLKTLRGSSVRVFVLSALDNEALVQEARRLGAYGFITKPFHPLDVQSLIRGALEGHGAPPW
jgi:two-component system chemotaxis response regulator CheY